MANSQETQTEYRVVWRRFILRASILLLMAGGCFAGADPLNVPSAAGGFFVGLVVMGFMVVYEA